MTTVYAQYKLLDYVAELPVTWLCDFFIIGSVVLSILGLFYFLTISTNCPHVFTAVPGDSSDSQSANHPLSASLSSRPPAHEQVQLASEASTHLHVSASEYEMTTPLPSEREDDDNLVGKHKACVTIIHPYVDILNVRLQRKPEQERDSVRRGRLRRGRPRN